MRAGEPTGTSRFFGDGRFFTPDGRGRFVAVRALVPRPIDPAFPLVLNTGRIRDQWHTMTRTGKSAQLSAHQPEPTVALHPDDAREASLGPGELVVCESPSGRIVGRAQIDPDQPRGTVFVPMHWTDQFASRGRVNALVPGRTDPVSGQPASKMGAARVRPFTALWYGFAVTRHGPARNSQDYWATTRVDGGFQTELAGLACPEDWLAFGRAVLGTDAEARLLTYDDPRGRQHRMALFRAGRLEGALFVSPKPLGIARVFLAAALTEALSEADGLRLLAGRPGEGRADRGYTVCSCWQVGINQIQAAIMGGCTTVAEVGAALKAGTNCGSCRPEIQRVISNTTRCVAAEPCSANRGERSSEHTP